MVVSHVTYVYEGSRMLRKEVKSAAAIILPYHIRPPTPLAHLIIWFMASSSTSQPAQRWRCVPGVTPKRGCWGVKEGDRKDKREGKRMMEGSLQCPFSVCNRGMLLHPREREREIEIRWIHNILT